MRVEEWPLVGTTMSRWNAEYDESRMLGVGRGKRWRLHQNLTYRHKHGTSAAYRDIYPSHLGRLDMNVCSSSDPGLTGYLTCNCQVDERGYFGGKDSEPDCYDPVIDARLATVANPKYAKKRLEIMMTEADRKDNGFIELRRKPSPIQMTKMFSDHPERYGLYAIGNRLKLLPKMDRTNKGFIKLEKKPGATLDLRAKPDRNSDGFLVLRYSNDKLSYK